MRYHLDRCTFCGQCVESCRFNCIVLSNTEWELATPDKTTFITTYGQVANASANLEKVTAADPEAPSDH